MRSRKTTSYRFRAAVSLTVVVLLFGGILSLAGCSDEVYDPTQGSLSLEEGTGSSNGQLEL